MLTCSTAQPWLSGRSSTSRPGEGGDHRGGPFGVRGVVDLDRLEGRVGGDLVVERDREVDDPGHRAPPRRAVSARRAVPVPGRFPAALGGLPEAVAQDPEALDLQLDLVAGDDLAPDLDRGAAVDGARAEQPPRPQRLTLRGPGDDLVEAEDRLVRVGVADGLAVQPRLHPQPGPPVELIDRRHHRPGAAAEVLALERAEPPLHLAELDVAGAEVVEDREAEDVGVGGLGAQVRALAADDHAELQLVVEPPRVARPRHLVARADERLGVADVGDRELEEDLRDRLAAQLPGTREVAGEDHVVAVAGRVESVDQARCGVEPARPLRVGERPPGRVEERLARGDPGGKAAGDQRRRQPTRRRVVRPAPLEPDPLGDPQVDPRPLDCGADQHPRFGPVGRRLDVAREVHVSRPRSSAADRTARGRCARPRRRRSPRPPPCR